MNTKITCILFLFLCSCTLIGQTNEKVAFMADVHFADVFPNSALASGEGIENPTPLLRTMGAQLRSTRLFNENYFAFRAALDDAVSKGITIIALPGDFTDDGQPIHVKGLHKVLKHYKEQHGITFLLAPGNHDPTTPFGDKGGKTNFLGINGKAQPVMSAKNMHLNNPKLENATIINKEVQEWGFKNIALELKAFGFFPQQEYLYWETPFSTYSYEAYSFKKSKSASKLKKRTYSTAASTLKIPDLSYLVEPTPGLWLLSLDANVFLKSAKGDFYGNGIGYNQVIAHKQYLVAWTQKVVAKAKALGKVLIAFSHYPMVDFNDGATEKMKTLFGEKAFQAHRNPDASVGRIFADAGLNIHVGGHMHLNDTGIVQTKKGNTLVNIQAPSLAAYPPGYKILEITSNTIVEVETVVLDSVPRFKTFFERYQQEAEFLASQQINSWNTKILDAQSYPIFTDTHLQELVRLRFLPKDWPQALKDLLIPYSGWDLLVSAQNFKQGLDTEQKLVAALNELKLTKADFIQWQGIDFITDFYRFRSGDILALKTIKDNRITAYKVLLQALKNCPKNATNAPLKLFGEIFELHMKENNTTKEYIETTNYKIVIKK